MVVHVSTDGVRTAGQDRSQAARGRAGRRGAGGGRAAVVGRTSGGPGGAGSAAPGDRQDPVAAAGYLAPAVAAADPVASAVAWLQATRSLSYADGSPSGWVARARPVVTDRLAADYERRRDGNAGADWPDFVAAGCVSVVTDADGVIPLEAPRTEDAVNVMLWWAIGGSGPGAGAPGASEQQNSAALGPAVAVTDPVASAVAWLQAARSGRATPTGRRRLGGPGPAGRDRPSGRGLRAAARRERGSRLAGFVGAGCVSVVTDASGVIPPEAPAPTAW